MNTRRVTLHDVAQAAGVSTTTASDALAGRGRIATDTREKVLAAARSLGYVVNSAARSLRSGHTGVIGLYMPDQVLGLDYYLQVLQGAADAAIASGYAITLIPQWPSPDRLAGLQLDALIVSDPSLTDPVMTAIRALRIPHICLERDLSADANPAAVINIDHRHGITALLAHLHEQGAERVTALVPPPTTAFGADIGRYLATADHPVTVHEVGFATDPAQLVSAVTDALAGAPDALIAVPDGAARLTLDVLISRGLDVPGQILLAGYTDAANHLFSRPDITAVDLQPAETGRLAVATVLAVLDGGAPAQAPLVQTHLRVRATTDRGR